MAKSERSKAERSKAELSKGDLNFILFSLRETKKKFASFDDAPNADYQRGRLREVEKIISKIETLQQDL